MSHPAYARLYSKPVVFANSFVLPTASRCTHYYHPHLWMKNQTKKNVQGTWQNDTISGSQSVWPEPLISPTIQRSDPHSPRSVGHTFPVAEMAITLAPKVVVNGTGHVEHSASCLHCPSTHCSVFKLTLFDHPRQMEASSGFQISKKQISQPSLGSTLQYFTALNSSLFCLFGMAQICLVASRAPHHLSPFREDVELMVTMSTQQSNLKVPVSNRISHGCFTLLMEQFIPPKAFHISTVL